MTGLLVFDDFAGLRMVYIYFCFQKLLYTVSASCLPIKDEIINYVWSPHNLRYRQAHLGGRRYLQQVVAESFTETDGNSRLYLGRESVFPGPSGWPVPHDAPYKADLDRWIMAVIEVGISCHYH